MSARLAVLVVLVLGVGYALGSGAVVIETGDTVGVAIDTDALVGDETTGAEPNLSGAEGGDEGPETTTQADAAVATTATPRERATMTPDPTDTTTTTEGTTTLAAELAGYDRDSLRERAVSRVNDYRDQHGKPTMDTSGTLQEAAQKHAHDQIVKDYLAHDQPDGDTLRDRLEAAGWPSPGGCGENLFGIEFERGYYDGIESEIVEEAFASWRASDGHRENMLGSYSSTGMGVGMIESDDELRIVFVQVFC